MRAVHANFTTAFRPGLYVHYVIIADRVYRGSYFMGTRDSSAGRTRGRLIHSALIFKLAADFSARCVRK